MHEKEVCHLVFNPILKEHTPIGPCDFIHKKEMIICVLFPVYQHIQSAEHSKAGHLMHLSLFQESKSSRLTPLAVRDEYLVSSGASGLYLG